MIGSPSCEFSILLHSGFRQGAKKQKIMPRKCRRKKKKLEPAGKCSEIMNIRGGGQCKCEKLCVKSALSCQNANLTVMIMSHFKKSLSLVVIFISGCPHSHHTVSHKQQPASQASLKAVRLINKIVESSN